MGTLIIANLGLTAIWILAYGGMSVYNARLLRIYQADKRTADQEIRRLPSNVARILQIQARGLIFRLWGRTLGCIGGALLGIVALISRAQGGGTPLSWSSTIFSLAFILGALFSGYQYRQELRDRAEMERLSGTAPPPA